jgi:predicted ABC-type ATPase
MPTFYLIAGPNGAGKTTFAKTFLPLYADCPRFLNADLIAAGISPFDPDKVAVRAGRILLEQMHSMIEQKETFSVETTLSGRGYLKLIHAMKADGYRFVLFYLWISSPEMAIARVAQRVRQGGHNIPEKVIRRRYSAGLQNLFDTYKDLADDWFLLDNRKIPPQLIAASEAGQTQILDHVTYDRLQHSTPN